MRLISCGRSSSTHDLGQAHSLRDLEHLWDLGVFDDQSLIKRRSPSVAGSLVGSILEKAKIKVLLATSPYELNFIHTIAVAQSQI